MKKTEYLVDREWLMHQLDNPQVVIVDCRFQLANPNWGEEQYRACHIKGAYYLDLNRDLSSEVQRHGGRHPLPDINMLAQKFAQMGIVNTAIRDGEDSEVYPFRETSPSLAVKNETLVVAYDNSRFAFAARLWWLLRYLGHNSVVLLDGGWNYWLMHGYPVNKAIPEHRRGSFSPQPNSD